MTTSSHMCSSIMTRGRGPRSEEAHENFQVLAKKCQYLTPVVLSYGVMFVKLLGEQFFKKTLSSKTANINQILKNCLYTAELQPTTVTSYRELIQYKTLDILFCHEE